MSGSIGDWESLYRQAFANLNPGGWLEIQEFEVWFYSQKPGGLPEDSAIARWQRLIDEGSARMGRRLNYASRFQAHLEQTGFVDVESRAIKVSPAVRRSQSSTTTPFPHNIQAETLLSVSDLHMAQRPQTP